MTFHIDIPMDTNKAVRVLFARKCDSCGNGMNEGYLLHGGIEYYCSDVCLRKNYSDDDWNDMYDDGEGDCHYTTWEDESDMEYELVDGKLIDLY
jgi:hypothetical protein